MTAMATATVALDTLADLLEHLGGIHPNRVRFRPSPGTATEEEVLVDRFVNTLQVLSASAPLKWLQLGRTASTAWQN